MNWTTELPFTLEGVEGELKIIYTPFGQKFFQNGKELKKSGSGFDGIKYTVQTIDGGVEVLKVMAKIKYGREVQFKGTTIKLEHELTGIQILLSMLPIASLTLLLFFFGGSIGLIGAALFGALGALGLMFVANMIRNEKEFLSQIITSCLISVACIAIYLMVGFIISLLFGLIFGAAFAFM